MSYTLLLVTWIMGSEIDGLAPPPPPWPGLSSMLPIWQTPPDAALTVVCPVQIVSTGLGLMEAPDGGLMVDFVVEDSPAAAAAVMVGDRLVEVNGTTTKGMGLK